MIWALPLLPALAGLAVWAMGDGSRLRSGLPAVLALAATLGLALAAGDWSGSYGWSETLTLRAGLTPLSHLVAVTVPAVALAVVCFAAGHEERAGLARLIGLLLVFVGGMELVLVAGDLLTLLIGWEVIGACSWALIAHRWRRAVPVHSANYAFVMTRAGDLGLFLALFAVHAQTARLDYGALSELDGPSLWVAAFGLLIAAAAKAGQVPFAPWLFRAMDGPTSVSALLHSAAMVAAGAYILARLQPELAGAPGFGGALVAVGLVTALAGGVVALREVHAKTVLAGSTSAQMGLMIAATGAGHPGVAVLHLVVHAAFKAPLFFAAGIAHDAAGSFDLRMMRLGRALPLTAVLAAVVALALAGVPPLSGGWSKEEVVKALGAASPWLALPAVAAGGLSAAYATRFALLAFWPGDLDRADGPSRAEIAAMSALALVTALLSVLWLPAAHEPLAGALDISLPHGPPIEMAVSLSLVALGLLAGLYLARHPLSPPRRRWLGLDDVVAATVIAPFGRAARAAAWADECILDAVPRGAARAARFIAGGAALGDDRFLDTLPRGAARSARAMARWAASSAESALDGLRPGDADAALAEDPRWRSGALGQMVAAASGLARWAGRTGEQAADLLAGGTGRLAGMAGHDARRLQSGLSHHYYALLAAGIAVGLAILILGA